MTSLNFFEQVERELVKAKSDQAAAERERQLHSAAHQKADDAAQRINRYVAVLEDSLDLLNASVGRKPQDSQ